MRSTRIYDQIAAEALSQQKIHTGRVTGSDAPKSTLGKGYDFQTLLTLFSPRSKEKAAIMPEEPGEIDILIATDCISEGQNLQDCDFLVNYDIHWNPVRIIQRFGRIDRIGSPNAQIQLANYWPDITLDDYIKLKERVENRMIIADVTATGDDNVLTAKASDTAYRREQLRRLQDEVIELEDVRTGISITDLGLNDFRMDLLNYVKEHGDLAAAPKGLHAVVPADPGKRGQRLRIAASSFSIFAFEALRKELQQIDELQFLFTEQTFTAERATDGKARERREFFIPKAKRVAGLTGSEFEIQLRNQLTQRAVARECAEWIRKKARFKSNASSSPMQQFLSADGVAGAVAYMPLSGFTAVDLGYARGNAVSNFVNRFDEASHTQSYIQLFDTIWSDPTRVEDVTDAICDHIASVYQENSPERIYFIMLYNIFHAFLEDIDEDVLPNDRTGYQESLVWQKLFNYQRDAATGIINKLETYNGCILADSVGLGKTFTALAVIKYYELRNRSVLVLCPKKLTDNWLNYSTNLKTNPFARDRFNYDVLCHTDLSRTSGTSNGIPLNRVNWGNYDLVVIDESHNFRNNDAFKEKETRYQKLMNQVIRAGVKTKVLMLSATPVNNRFNDLRNQLALAYEGQSEILSEKLNTTSSVEEIFRRAQAAFNRWSKLPPEQRTAETILTELDFDFFELLDSVTIARSRKHITTFYDMTDIGHFPERRKPLSFRPPLTELSGTMDLNTIVAQLTLLKLSVYAPTSYILPSRLAKYEDLYDTDVSSGGGKLRQADRDKSLQALMTVKASSAVIGQLSRDICRLYRPPGIGAQAARLCRDAKITAEERSAKFGNHFFHRVCIIAKAFTEGPRAT